MSTYTVGVIGSGGIGEAHGRGYRTLDNCDLVACSDIDSDTRASFVDEFGIEGAYEDYRDMLADGDLDVVSVCTPPGTHADIVLDCAAADGLRAIHCEKPMAHTWGTARLMAQECRRRGIQLTFNHQLRLTEPARRAKELLDDGAIGDLERLEWARSDIYESGTHMFDVVNYLNDDRPAEWILSQIEYSERNVKKGLHNENQALALWAYPNGVHGMAFAGLGDAVLDCSVRIRGSEGEMELDIDKAAVRIRPDGGGWERVECADNMRGHWSTVIEHVIESLDCDVEPLLSGRRALNTTELIFGARESSRRRGRVDFPLTVDDDPLASMLESGVLKPE